MIFIDGRTSAAIRSVQIIYSVFPLIWFVSTGSWLAGLIALYMLHRGTRPLANVWPR